MEGSSLRMILKILQICVSFCLLVLPCKAWSVLFSLTLKHVGKALCTWIRLRTGVGVTNRNSGLLNGYEFPAIAENCCNFPVQTDRT